jgi:hypothetical protein
VSIEGMAGDLRLLNDVLAGTVLADRYWLFGGLVLGWARERGLMAHDVADADFAVLAEDLPLLEQSAETLFAAGFRPLYRFPGGDAPPTEYSFHRNGRKFEFFRVEVRGKAFRWHNYAQHGDRGPVMNICEIPAQPLSEVSLVGRRWLKARDHDVELTGLFGDWRTPRPDWDYLHAPCIVETHPWDNRNFGWTP